MSFLRKQESRPISGFPLLREQVWIPASAGMTNDKA